MKLSLKTLFFTLFLCFCLTSLSAETVLSDTENPQGIDLCESVFSYLKKSKLSPKTQNLVTNGTNQFPYNILLEFYNSPDQSDDTLILIFKMEDAFKYKELVQKTADSLQKENINSIILISYGENQKFLQRGMINGSSVFVKTLDMKGNNAAVIFNFNQTKNGVITGSMGNSSPSWLIRNAYAAFNNAKIKKDIPIYYLSQPSKFNLMNNRIMGTFFRNNIPAVGINFRSAESPEDMEKHIAVIQSFISDYVNIPQKVNEYHSLMFLFFGKTIWLSEFKIIIIIITTLLASLIFIFSLGFINRNIQNEAWKQIKNNWFIIPITFLICTGSCYLGKYLNILFHRTASTMGNGTAFGMITLELSIAFFAVSLFYFFELFFRKSYTERSLDFLILISTFINQFLFSIADVSLFPLFFLCTICAILSLIFENNKIHIVFGLLMVMPFIPYILRLYADTETTSLVLFFWRTNQAPLFLSFIFVPLFLFYLRILTAIKIKIPEKKVFITTLIITYVLSVLFLVVINFTIFGKKQTQQTYTRAIRVNEEGYDSSLEDKINITYTDTKIFQEIVRSVTVKSDIKAEIIEVIVESDEANPVQYSDNDYTSSTTKSASFSIPAYPPQNMTFKYGATKAPSTVKVNAIYSVGDKYISVSKSIPVEGKK